MSFDDFTMAPNENKISDDYRERALNRFWSCIKNGSLLFHR